MLRKVDDRGSISALVLGLLMSFIACAGLVLDGGRIVATKVRASDRAENAARVGAQAVTNIRLGVHSIDPPEAVRLVRRFLSSTGSSGSVFANKIEVCVVVSDQVKMSILSLVGVRSREVATERCARPIME